MIRMFARVFLFGLALSVALPSAVALAAGWNVTVKAHRIEALSNSDNWGEQDMYWQAHLKATVGSGGPVDCSTVNNHTDDDNEITPKWECTLAAVTGGPNTVVEIKIEVMEEDTIGDDELDLSVDHNQLGLAMLFEPRTSKLTILGDPTWTPGRCAFGKITRSGFGGGGAEPAEIEFTISASPAGAPDGDSDIDGLPDSWEICGVSTDGNDSVEVPLDKLGADPARKDVFVEIDWMEDATSASPHTHAPWLPAMIQAWNEFDRAWVSNPTINGAIKLGGIALHLDTGTLYSNYSFDIDGAAPPAITVGSSGNLDLNSDGIPDIGNLGSIGSTPPFVGGTPLPEDALLQPRPGVTGMPTAADMFAPGSEFATLKATRFTPAREVAFHYAVFAHSYTQVVGGPVNSGGLAEPCAIDTPCNEFMTTLSTFGRQTVDADRNSIPDGVTVINGPKNLPVDGLIIDHASIFLHEIGHNFGLHHGGGDTDNFKPNYFSIMNYAFSNGLSFDWNNDGRGDGLGIDFDRDGIADVRRFQYSALAGLPIPPALNEGVPPPSFLNEAAPVAPGYFVLTSFTCPPTTAVPNPVPTVFRADNGANWNCNGTPGETNVQAEINQSSALEILDSFDDSNDLANGGLNVWPSISLEERRQRDANTRRILEPQGREEFVLNQCVKPRRLDFENLTRGTVVRSQFAPEVEFVEDGLRTPTVLALSDRNGVPTASPDHSLANLPRSGAVTPLMFSFKDPQRAVSVRFGQSGLGGSPRDRVRAVLQAFDQNDVSMGYIIKALPLPSQGITEMLTAATVYPDQLIQRVEIRYEVGIVTGSATINAPVSEPVQIDDLVYCGRLSEAGIKPAFPPPPVFGRQSLRLHVASEALMEMPGSGEPGNTITVPSAFTGLPIQIDGASATTATDVTRPEGTTLNLKAPTNSSVGPFLYWRYGNGVSFGNGVTEIPLTLLKNGTVTAVYLAREGMPCNCPGDPAQPPEYPPKVSKELTAR